MNKKNASEKIANKILRDISSSEGKKRLIDSYRKDDDFKYLKKHMEILGKK